MIGCHKLGSKSLSELCCAPAATNRCASALSAAHEHTVEEQKKYRASNCKGKAADAPIIGSCASPDRPSDKSADHGAADSKQYSDHKAARVATRHKQFCDRSGDQTKDDPTDNGSHNLSLTPISCPVVFASLPD